MEPTNRQDKILKAIVEEYIDTGLPVGSKLLSQTLGLGVSSATIRSEMSTLYDFGFLEQPYTSAGRIPSHMGIRRYIDNMMEMKTITRSAKNKIDSLFNIKNPDPDKLLIDAAKALSEYTGYAAITSSLISDKVTIRRLEFIGAGYNTIVIILSASNGVVKSKVCRLDFIVTDAILEFFTKFANASFADKPIESISSSYVNSVAFALGEYSRYFTSLIIAVYELCQEISVGSYYVSGGTNLFVYGEELAEIAKELLSIIENTEHLQKLFGSKMANKEILIGRENADVELTDASVIITEYYVDAQPSGTVGLIGPVNMDYAKVIPQLDYFAEMLGKLLEDTLTPNIEDDIDI